MALSTAAAQEDAPTLPTVTSFKCPTYPSNAESMKVSGVVKLKVRTDGHAVADVKVTSGHPALIPEAIKNVQTWKFSDHAPTTFDVTFLYTNDGYYERDKITKCSARMELPTKVTVSTKFRF
jgi:outer membrane biosynthesis protein TonB